MVSELVRIYKEQRTFMMKFRVPTEVDNGEVKKWRDVEFETHLNDLSLKGDKATCHGTITHSGAVSMSDLIQNWKTGVEFFLDGIQQSLF